MQHTASTVAGGSCRRPATKRWTGRRLPRMMSRMASRLATGEAPRVDAAAPERPDRFYTLVRLFARFWVWFFFKRVDVRHAGRVPSGGAALLCINHPNNLIDSRLVGAVLPRKVHYLATSALFRNALLARFLRACGAIPV